MWASFRVSASNSGRREKRDVIACHARSSIVGLRAAISSVADGIAKHEATEEIMFKTQYGNSDPRIAELNPATRAWSKTLGGPIPLNLRPVSAGIAR